LKALGRHVLVEFYNCDVQALKEVDLVKQSMIDASLAAGATIVESVFHTFNPWGVSGVVVISESHLAIHTWPEYGYASVDLFTCGETVDPWKSYESLKKAFNPEHTRFVELSRGDLDVRTGAPFFKDTLQIQTQLIA
jgi:S-adenosylmethionine decarboxylase proenzyme